MNKLIIIIIILFISITIFSCKTDNIEQVLKTSENPELDMVFHSIIIENKVNGTTLAIVDKASERKSNGIAEFDTIKQTQNDVIYWNKNIFPKIEYLSQKLLDKKLEILTLNDEKIFWEFAKKYNQGWIKISQPIFTNDKKRHI